jgi:hypothetical protein
MTRLELINLLSLPPETTASALLKARAARLAELQDQLQQEGLPKPVKIMLNRELADLRTPAANELEAQLERISRAETLLEGIDDEMAKSGWTRGVVELLCRKLEPLVPGIPEEDERLKFEKRLIEIAEKIKVVASPAPPPTPAQVDPKPAAVSSMPPHDVASRLEAYFAEITRERTKPLPSRGVVRLWLQKISAAIDQLPDEATHLACEKRVIEIEYWLDGSQPPWPKPAKTESREQTPLPPNRPQKPIPGTLLQLLPKAADGTLRRTGPPIHFVVRPRFILGRHRLKADFVTRFLPSTPANDQKTESISRVNTTLTVKGSQLWINDGEIMEDGKIKPSAGTLIDGQPLTTTPLQLNFSKERRLKLGQSGYELTALHLPAMAPEGPTGGMKALDDTDSSQATVVLPSHPFGCMRFLGVSSREVEVQAVWLFSDAAIGAGLNCAVVLDGAGLPAVALHVHHWEKGFWLVVPGGKSKVQLDGKPLAGGEVCALQGAHQLVLGTLHYELKVSA